MKPIPITTDPPVLLTDFTHTPAWQTIQSQITQPYDLGLEAHVEFITDPAYANLTPDQILDLLPDTYPHPFLVLVDHTALTTPDHPVLVIDLLDTPGRSFRSLPSQIQSIENNLSIANMDFAAFADHLAPDNIFRGFEEA